MASDYKSWKLWSTLSRGGGQDGEDTGGREGRTGRTLRGIIKGKSRSMRLCKRMVVVVVCVCASCFVIKASAQSAANILRSFLCLCCPSGLLRFSESWASTWNSSVVRKNSKRSDGNWFWPSSKIQAKGSQVVYSSAVEFKHFRGTKNIWNPPLLRLKCFYKVTYTVILLISPAFLFTLYFNVLPSKSQQQYSLTSALQLNHLM